MDIIIKKLINNIRNSNQNKSSYWQKYLPIQGNYLNEFEHSNFGSYTNKKYIKNLFHNLLARIIYGNDIFKTETYKNFKKYFDKIDRHIDNDTIRHIFTFEKLKKFTNPKTICIIGDGKINGVLGAHLTFPKAKLFSLNLSEVLINDYIILKKIDFFKNSTKLVDQINFSAKSAKLTLIPSNFYKFLLNKNIELFINIASFQEMKKSEIAKYFKIIKKNKSKLYCCNREYKKLPGGEKVYFKNYQFSNSKIIFWENCTWSKKFYSLKPPFVHMYDGNIKHCLVDFK